MEELTAWSQIAGNAKVKSYLMKVLEVIKSGRMKDEEFSRYSVAILGASGSGKSAMCNLFLKCMFCENFDLRRMSTCEECKFCLNRSFRDGWLAYAIHDEPLGWVKIMQLSGENCNDTGITEVLSEAQYSSPAIVFIDEFQGLIKKSLDGKLLVPMEQCKNVLWIVAGTSLANAHIALKRRLHTIDTERPDFQEYAKWIADLCVHQGVKILDKEIIAKVATKTRGLPAVGKKIIERSHLFGSVLNEDCL